MLLNILLFLSVIITSITFSVVIATAFFSNRQRRKSSINKSNSITRRFYITLALLVVLIAGSLFFGLEIYQKWQHDNNVEKIANELAEKELEIKAKENAQILKENVQKKKVLVFVQSYLHAYSLKNIDSVNQFYSFPLKKYYTFYNVSKEKVDERIRFYWRHNDDPEFIVTDENTEIKNNDNGAFFVSIKMKEHRRQSILLNLKIDSSFKIYSVGNYIVTEEIDFEDSLSVKDSK